MSYKVVSSSSRPVQQGDLVQYVFGIGCHPEGVVTQSHIGRVLPQMRRSKFGHILVLVEWPSRPHQRSGTVQSWHKASRLQRVEMLDDTRQIVPQAFVKARPVVSRSTPRKPIGRLLEQSFLPPQMRDGDFFQRPNVGAKSP